MEPSDPAALAMEAPTKMGNVRQSEFEVWQPCCGHQIIQNVTDTDSRSHTIEQCLLGEVETVRLQAGLAHDSDAGMPACACLMRAWRPLPRQGADFLSSLEPVVRALEAVAPAARLDCKGLAALSAQLQQFQEDALGVKVSTQPSSQPPGGAQAAVLSPGRPLLGSWQGKHIHRSMATRHIPTTTHGARAMGRRSRPSPSPSCRQRCFETSARVAGCSTLQRHACGSRSCTASRSWTSHLLRIASW